MLSSVTTSYHTHCEPFQFLDLTVGAKKEVLPCLSLPRSSFFGFFLAIPAALVAIPVSFTVGGIFHTVGESAAALPHCSVTERQFRVWVAALCRRQAHAHQNASLVLRQGR